MKLKNLLILEQRWAYPFKLATFERMREAIS